MKLSRALPAASGAPSALSLPPSRCTPNTGCATSCTLSRRSAISPITEFDQKRHVVVDDLDHRDRLALAGFFQRHRLAADFRRARLPLAQEIESALGEIGEIGGGVAQHVLRHGAGVELRDEARRDIAAARGKQRRGLIDHGAGGAVVFADGNVHGHGIMHRLLDSVEHGLELSHSVAGDREQHTIW